MNNMTPSQENLIHAYADVIKEQKNFMRMLGEQFCEYSDCEACPIFTRCEEAESSLYAAYTALEDILKTSTEDKGATA